MVVGNKKAWFLLLLLAIERGILNDDMDDAALGVGAEGVILLDGGSGGGLAYCCWWAC